MDIRGLHIHLLQVAWRTLWITWVRSRRGHSLLLVNILHDRIHSDYIVPRLSPSSSSLSKYVLWRRRFMIVYMCDWFLCCGVVEMQLIQQAGVTHQAELKVTRATAVSERNNLPPTNSQKELKTTTYDQQKFTGEASRCCKCTFVIDLYTSPSHNNENGSRIYYN